MVYSRAQLTALFSGGQCVFGGVSAGSRMSLSLIGRVLLAFSLLWSQQAALSHSVSHLVKAGRAQTTAVRKATKPLQLVPSCAECFAHAQFFSVMGSRLFFSAMKKSARLRLVFLAACNNCILKAFGFQPRAPPLS